MDEPASITVTIQNDGLINEGNINEYHQDDQIMNNYLPTNNGCIKNINVNYEKKNMTYLT